MRTIKILTILLLYSLSVAFGQESEKYLKLKSKRNYHEGYIINLDSVKVKGLVKANINKEEERQYSMVEFFGVDGSETRYRPYDLKGYGYATENFVSDYGSFYKVILSGKRAGVYVKLISYGRGGGGMVPQTGYSQRNLYVVKNGKSDFRYVTRKGFKEEFSQYFGDCEKLKLKIQSEQVTSKDVELVVREYNDCQ
ncbi:MAG TPA: hypothetical protein PLJ60_04895 [Chryseolinea sp.]|nr:hypothetical protein [Chryseolinea sp.]HPM29655.1 hypothetical protein [Chryseolinea sp.]